MALCGNYDVVRSQLQVSASSISKWLYQELVVHLSSQVTKLQHLGKKSARKKKYSKITY